MLNEELYTETYCRRVLAEIITNHVAKYYSIDELQHIYLLLDKIGQDAKKEILEAMLNNYLQDSMKTVSNMVGITEEELQQIVQ